MDFSLYPSSEEIRVRTISDGYGATIIANKYIKSQRDYFARNFSWQHGWIPDLWNIDRDEVIGEIYSKRFKTIFVARKTQEKYLSQSGVIAKAIGLPFCYVKSIGIEREAKSLLVMPTHSTLSIGAKENLGFLEEIKKYKDSFNHIFVCMHEEDIRRKRDEIWEKEGFNVISGASFTDSNSLIRNKFLFNSFEVMVTDSIGSHVFYAASSGVRVSIISVERPREIDSKEPFYSGRSKLYLSKLAELIYILNNSKLSPFPSLFFNPVKAKKNVSLGEAEIGYENMLSANDLRYNFGWNYSEYFLQRIRIGLKKFKFSVFKK